MLYFFFFVCSLGNTAQSEQSLTITGEEKTSQPHELITSAEPSEDLTTIIHLGSLETKPEVSVRSTENSSNFMTSAEPRDTTERVIEFSPNGTFDASLNAKFSTPESATFTTTAEYGHDITTSVDSRDNEEEFSIEHDELSETHDLEESIVDDFFTTESHILATSAESETSEESICSGQFGDVHCVCEDGYQKVAEELPMLGGRRKMAIMGEESYCEGSNSCKFEQESMMAGPIDLYFECLSLDTMETYEVTSYFPDSGDLMSEDSSNYMCDNYTFNCREEGDSSNFMTSAEPRDTTERVIEFSPNGTIDASLNAIFSTPESATFTTPAEYGHDITTSVDSRDNEEEFLMEHYEFSETHYLEESIVDDFFTTESLILATSSEYLPDFIASVESRDTTEMHFEEMFEFLEIEALDESTEANHFTNEPEILEYSLEFMASSEPSEEAVICPEGTHLHMDGLCYCDSNNLLSYEFDCNTTDIFQMGILEILHSEELDESMDNLLTDIIIESQYYDEEMDLLFLESSDSLDSLEIDESMDSLPIDGILEVEEWILYPMKEGIQDDYDDVDDDVIVYEITPEYTFTKEAAFATAIGIFLISTAIYWWCICTKPNKPQAYSPLLSEDYEVWL